MSRLSPHPRSRSSASISSDTTYHNLNHAELREPLTRCDSGKEAEALTTPYEMHRQDSGYESLTPASSQTYSRRRSSTSVVSSGSRPQTRSSVRRASRSGPVVYVSRDSIQPVGTTTCCQRYRKWEKGTYHFPHFVSAHHVQAPCATDGDNSLAAGASPHASDSKYEAGLESTGASTYPSPPPQTTHYWTSDRTRRLEYAAIDAASRGVRGWVMRHMVPDCFIPEDCRPVRFDDDRGSVVRYRLELDGDDKAEKERPRSTKKRRSRWFGTTHS